MTERTMQERLLQSLQTGPSLGSSETLRIIERLDELEADKAELLDDLKSALDLADYLLGGPPTDAQEYREIGAQLDAIRAKHGPEKEKETA